MGKSTYTHTYIHFLGKDYIYIYIYLHIHIFIYIHTCIHMYTYFLPSHLYVYTHAQIVSLMDHTNKELYGNDMGGTFIIHIDICIYT